MSDEETSKISKTQLKKKHIQEKKVISNSKFKFFSNLKRDVNKF